MKRLLLLPVIGAILLVGLSCGGEEAKVVSPQPSITASPEAAGARPTATVAAAEPTRAPTASPQPTVAATVPPEPTGIPWEEAVNYIGEEGTVCGPVPYAHYWSEDRGQPTFLAIGDSYLDPAHFDVIIWGEDRSNFPAAVEDTYPGNTVCVTGWIEPYLDSSQMTVSSPREAVIVATPAAESATPQVAMTSEPRPVAPPTPPDFSPFLGSWGRHGFGIAVTASGEATATWRVYKWCSDDPTPPCDDMTDSEITSGGRATIVFDRVAGETAYGWVEESTEEEVLSGRIALTLQPYGMALLEPIGNELYDYEIPLCGPNFWQEAPEDLKEQSPCGA